MAMFWDPLSQAIVFGLSFATVLTLIATPTMLAFPVAVKERLYKHRERRAANKGSTLGNPTPAG